MFAVRVVQAAASQREVTWKPFLAHEKVRCQALQAQAKADQSFVPRPRWLQFRRLQKRIIINNAFQQSAGFLELPESDFVSYDGTHEIRTIGRTYSNTLRV